MLINDPENIQLRSEEVQVILQRTPHWMVRWGTMLFLALILALFFLAWLIRYPDALSARAVVLADFPSLGIVPKTSARIDSLWVLDRSSVRKGQRLASLDNPADFKDIEKLKSLVAQLSTLAPEAYASVPLPSDLRVADVQAAYSNLRDKIQDYLYFARTQASLKQRMMLMEQAGYYRKLNLSLEQQLQNLQQEKLLAQQILAREQALVNDGASAKVNLDKPTAELLAINNRLEALRMEMISNNLKISELDKSIEDLRLNAGEIESTKSRAAREAVAQLKGMLDSWDENFNLYAPTDGQVQFNKDLRQGSFVSAGNAIMTVVPEQGKSSYRVRLVLPEANSGKVAPGQRVNIRLDAYPYRQHGVLQGLVQAVAPFPDAEGMRLVDVSLPQGLLSSHRENLQYRPEMQGTAIVITEDRRLIHRLFDNIKSLAEQ